MSQLTPHEFAPGDKVLVYQSPVKCEVIHKLSEHWLEVISEDGKDAYRVPVQFVAPENSVAVILTREQAGNIRLCLEAVLEYDDFTALEELKNQIEEKLSK